MALVKRREFAGGTAGEVLRLGDIEAEAAAILADARREREEMLSAARQAIAQQREQALAAGREEGYQAGLEQGRTEGCEQALQEARQAFGKEAASVLASLVQMCRAFDEHKQRFLWEAEQGTVSLAVAIAKKVVKDPLLATPETAGRNLKAALSLIDQKTHVVVKVHEADVAELEKLSGQASALGTYGSLTFESSREVDRGGCVVCTEHGEIDAQLASQVERIAAELFMKDTAASGGADDAVAERLAEGGGALAVGCDVEAVE